MAITTETRRNGAHPIAKHPGFDFLYIYADTAVELDEAMAAAERKFWQTWTAGVKLTTGKAGAVMYKPCDADSPWEDSPENHHPGNPRHQ